MRTEMPGSGRPTVTAARTPSYAFDVIMPVSVMP